MLDQKPIPQTLLEFSGHLVFHQNTNNINYINVFVVKKNANAFTPQKVISPAAKKFSLKSCVTSIGISDPNGLMLEVRIVFWVFVCLNTEPECISGLIQKGNRL